MMPRVAQFGIALGALGAVLTFMGLFPGVTGLKPAAVGMESQASLAAKKASERSRARLAAASL